MMQYETLPDGRLAVPVPCKFGDRVYVLDRGRKIKGYCARTPDRLPSVTLASFSADMLGLIGTEVFLHIEDTVEPLEKAFAEYFKEDNDAD